ncbi:hypothetical protein MMC11_000350 [Xylographa trunciseda]|nr:hypothetical protein [Xylographa trunciseda]
MSVFPEEGRTLSLCMEPFKYEPAAEVKKRGDDMMLREEAPKRSLDNDSEENALENDDGSESTPEAPKFGPQLIY